jgi:hypothetical protein
MPAMTISVEFLMNIAADVGELMSMGGGPLGERRVVAITGGTFEGPRLRGAIVPGGAELQWLNRAIAVATAQRKARQVLLAAYQLL